MQTNFPDLFTPGVISVLIAHVQRTVGAKCKLTDFIRSSSILLVVQGKSPREKGSVIVDLDRKERRIFWTVRASEQKLVTHTKNFLKVFKKGLNDLMRQIGFV